jgi:membrane associated rhomboid family serine protease
VTRVVRALLIANVVLWIAQIALPGLHLTEWLAFYPPAVLTRPWTIVTYMFIHDPNGLTHILFNMILLYFFGPRVESHMGSRRFAILYFVSGIGGAAASFLFAHESPILGASGALFGVMLAFARYWPNATILLWMVIPIPAWLLVILTTLMEFWFGRTGMESGVAHFAHLGGYAGAALYLVWLERSRKAFRRQIQHATPEIAGKVKRWEGVDLARVHEVNRAEVARILDKIAKSGVAALTPEERLFLSNFVPYDDQAGSQIQ